MAAFAQPDPLAAANGPQLRAALGLGALVAEDALHIRQVSFFFGPPHEQLDFFFRATVQKDDMRDLFTFGSVSNLEARSDFLNQVIAENPADARYMPAAGFWESIERAGECFLYIEDLKEQRDDMHELDKVIIGLQELANKIVPPDDNDAKYIGDMQLLIGAYILYALQIKLRNVEQEDLDKSTDEMKKVLIQICKKRTYPWRKKSIADLLPETNNVEDIDRIVQEVRPSFTDGTDSSISMLQDASTRNTSVASSVLGSPTKSSPARRTPAKASPARPENYDVGASEMRLPDSVSQDAQAMLGEAFFDRDRMPVFLIGALALRRHYRRRTDVKLWI